MAYTCWLCYATIDDNQSYFYSTQCGVHMCVKCGLVTEHIEIMETNNGKMKIGVSPCQACNRPLCDWALIYYTLIDDPCCGGLKK